MEKYKYGNQLNISVNKNAELNVKNKYVTYKGQIFSVVNNFEDSVFVFNKKFIDDLSTEPHPNFSCMTSTILYIEKNSTITFDATNVPGSVINVFNFETIPSDSLNYTKANISGDENYEYSCKKGSYLLLQVWHGSSDTLKENTSKLNTFFSFK